MRVLGFSSAQSPLRTPFCLEKKKSKPLWEAYKAPCHLHPSPLQHRYQSPLSLTLTLLQRHRFFSQLLEHPRFTPPSGTLHLPYPLPGILLFVVSAWLRPWPCLGPAETYPEAIQFSPSLSLPLWSKPSPAPACITQQSQFNITTQPQHSMPPVLPSFSL